MTCGIYSLYWEEQNLTYIGQSINIKRRFKEHIRQLSNNTHCNFKLQNAYNKYGMPHTSVLEVCEEVDLNNLEVYWTIEFDSLNPVTGLSLIEPGLVSGRGTRHSSSKYSKQQVLNCFRHLYRTNPIIQYKSISSITGVDINMVASIKNGNAHIWLKERFPTSYNKMLGISRAAIDKYKNNPVEIISSTGEICKVTNVSEFALKNNLDHSFLNRMILGRVKSCKGWKLYIRKNI